MIMYMVYIEKGHFSFALEIFIHLHAVMNKSDRRGNVSVLITFLGNP